MNICSITYGKNANQEKVELLRLQSGDYRVLGTSDRNIEIKELECAFQSFLLRETVN